jgi:hypothetical protein
LELRGIDTNQSDKSTARLYTDEEPSLKYKVTSPTISIAPGPIFCVEKPRTAMLAKVPGLVSTKVPVGLTRSRSEKPYAPSPNV